VTKAVKRSRPKGARYQRGDKQLNIATSNGMLYQFARSPLVISADGKTVTARSKKEYADKQNDWRPWHWTDRIARWMKPIVERELKKYVEGVWKRG
jgi:hypothetical protein